MVNRMNAGNYIKINTKNLLDNIQYIKKNYSYDSYIVDVSNEAFSHGMYFVKYLKDQVDFLYVHDFSDLLLIRKYELDFPVIYDGEIHEENVYDLIMNNAIVVIHEIDTLQMIRSLQIKDTLSFLFYIDPTGFYGIHSKQDILDYLEWNDKYLQLLGVIAHIDEEDYDDFKYIIRPIQNSKLMILNHEEDKRKIQGSNAIKLDYSIYGINQSKKKMFQKKDMPLKQVLSLHSKVISVNMIPSNKKVKYTAIIPFGYHHGMSDAIKYVFIKGKLYLVEKIYNEFVYVSVDEEIKKDMDVEITSDHNPLKNYFQLQTLNYFSLFYSHLPIIFDDYVLEKTLIY